MSPQEGKNKRPRYDGWWVALGGLLILGVGAFLWSGSDDRGIENAPVKPTSEDRVHQCGTTSGEVDARLDACLAELDTAPLSRDARELVRSLGDSGKTLTLGPRVDANSPQLALAEVPGARQALLGTDEAAVAQLLRDADVRGLVVYRDLTNALDRDRRVLARLSHHDHLEWFQLRRVTDELFIYTVRHSSTHMPLATGDQLLRGLRARLEGWPVIPRQSWEPTSIRMIGSMRLQGRTLVMRHVTGSNIESALNDLAAKLKRRWDREVAIYGHGTLRERIEDIRLEVHIVMERAPVEPRTRLAIFDLWELGQDGMTFRQRDGVDDQKFSYLPGSEAVTLSINSPDRFLQEGCQQGGWRDTRPWEQDPRTQLDIIRTQHFMEAETGGGPAVRLVRGMPEVTDADLTDDHLRQMLVDGGEWWLTNMHPDGSINYKYWPVQNRASTEYNEVRHILATRDLADTWRYRPDDRYLEGSVRAMDWLKQYTIRGDAPPSPSTNLPHPPAGTLLFRYPLRDQGSKPANQKLGTVAVALLGWVAWADATGDHSEDENIRQMARFVLSMKESNGKFNPYFVPFGHPYYGQKNDIVPGEAALALGKVALYFGEDEWLTFMPDFLDYYEPWWRKRAAKTLETGRWPQGSYSNDTRLDLVQFGPWSVMAARQYYELTGDARAAEFGLEVADWMIDWYQWSEERSPWPDYVGGYYKLPTELPAMQTFCYSEGTAAAYRIAALYAPERKDKYDRSTREALRMLEVMQFDDLDSYFVSRPDLVHGGVKYAMNENKIRIDYVGHGLSTVVQYLDARAADPAVELQLTPWEDLADTTRHVEAQELDGDSSGGDESDEEEGL